MLSRRRSAVSRPLRLKQQPSPAERVTLVAGTLLVAALTLLPWYSTGPAPTPGGATGRTAVQGPGALFGIAAAVVAAAGVAWLAVATLIRPTPRSPLPPPGRAQLPLWAAGLALVVAKLLTKTDDLAVGTWASLLLATALVASQVVLVARARGPARPVSPG